MKFRNNAVLLFVVQNDNYLYISRLHLKMVMKLDKPIRNYFSFKQNCFETSFILKSNILPSNVICVIIVIVAACFRCALLKRQMRSMEVKVTCSLFHSQIENPTITQCSLATHVSLLCKELSREETMSSVNVVCFLQFKD